MPHTWPLTLLTTTIRLEHPLCPDHPSPSTYRPTRPRPPVPIHLQTDTPQTTRLHHPTDRHAPYHPSPSPYTPTRPIPPVPITLQTDMPHTTRPHHPTDRRAPDPPVPITLQTDTPQTPVPMTLQTDTHAGHAQATVSHAPSGSSTKKMRGNADHTCRQNQGIPEVPGCCSLTRTLWPKHAHRTNPRLVPTCPEAGR